MTAPLVLSFDVACPADHAFTVWTEKIGTWWPPDHTVSGLRDAVIVMERGVGGRIYERTPEGAEHDWGEITAWEPPHHLAYRWHIGRGRTDATDVEIRFLPRSPSATRIEIDHRGWDHLGVDAPMWRDRNRIGWETLIPHFITASTEGVAP
jgi:uncharacterized protein YndB with AHSA1/START domain